MENVQVQITRVVRGKTPLLNKLAFSGDDKHGKSQDDLLSIYLKITNLDDGRKLDYRSFNGNRFGGRDNPELTDDLGNHYKGIAFGFSAQPEGSTESESIYPEKSAADHLVFELPVGKAEFLVLELSARNTSGFPRGSSGSRFRSQRSAKGEARQRPMRLSAGLASAFAKTLRLLLSRGQLATLNNQGASASVPTIRSGGNPDLGPVWCLAAPRGHFLRESKHGRSGKRKTS